MSWESPSKKTTTVPYGNLHPTGKSIIYTLSPHICLESIVVDPEWICYRSGSGSKFAEFWIRILFRILHFFLKEKLQLFIKISLVDAFRPNTSTNCQFWHFHLLFITKNAPEGLKTYILISFLLWSFMLAGSGSRTLSYGSGSGKNFRIRPDPDPQHCFKGNLQ